MRKIVLESNQEIEIQLPNNHYIALEALEIDGGFSVCAWEHDCSLVTTRPGKGVIEFKVVRPSGDGQKGEM